MPGLIPWLPDDVVAVSCGAKDTHNWKIWRKVHSVSVGLDSRKYSADLISYQNDGKGCMMIVDKIRRA
jgi:hypothetical protein